jgi:hypothetical protein
MKGARGVAAALAAVMVGVGSLFAYYLHDRSAHEMMALHYVRETVPVLTLWNAAVTRTYLAPAGLTGTSDEAMSQAISKMSRLGHLQNAGEPKLTNLSFGVNPSLGFYRLATFEVPARFDAGEGTVKIRILDEEGKLSVFAFHVTTTASTGGESEASHAGLAEYHAAAR